MASAEEQARRIEDAGESIDPRAEALAGIKRSWTHEDSACQQLALLDAIAWGLVRIGDELEKLRKGETA